MSKSAPRKSFFPYSMLNAHVSGLLGSSGSHCSIAKSWTVGPPQKVFVVTFESLRNFATPETSWPQLKLRIKQIA